MTDAQFRTIFVQQLYDGPTNLDVGGFFEIPKRNKNETFANSAIEKTYQDWMSRNGYQAS